MTARESILAALTQAAGGHGIEATFSLEEIYMLAFNADPKRFSMRGYRGYLDTKRIYAEVSFMLPAKTRLQVSRRKGLIERTADGRYRLTVEGLTIGQQLQAKGAA